MWSRSITRRVLGLLLALPAEIRAITFESAPQPDLDLSSLGTIAFAGSFNSLSLYEYVGQTQSGLHPNGSQSLLARYPDGDLANVAAADAHIAALCPLVTSDGTYQGIVVGGNFSSLGGQAAPAAALFDTTTGSVTPLTGLTGSVNALYFDSDSSTVYFGGMFTAQNSTNAIAWTTTWTNLPFAGFNGPVSAITKLPNGHILFGGSFTGIGNVSQPSVPEAQVVNLGSANITSGPNTSQKGLDDPRNIICASPSSGSDQGWLLADGQQGDWQAKFNFGFNPTKLRLYQSQVANHGTKTWAFTSLPVGGIMNFTYYDANGEQSCSNECPLPEHNSTYQDFYFVNTIGMNGFKIDIVDWYGKGGGLAGIELFQSDIYTFAVNRFNEPQCDGVNPIAATSTSTGDWQYSENYPTTPQYLMRHFPHGTVHGTDGASVIFQPDIREAGNYTVTVYTPGCAVDGSCPFRGEVNITGNLGTSTGSASAPFSTTLYQTNEYDKYDEVYFGFVDTTTSGFRPSITLTPTAGQHIKNLTTVAQRVRFQLISSTGGLNGLYEYNPSVTTVNTDFSSSRLNSAGISLNDGAEITSLDIIDNVPYVGGKFTGDNINNVMYIGNDNATSLANKGLNAGVTSLYVNGSLLYIGGNFTNTGDNSQTGLANVAVYDTSAHTWQALGAGVNGVVLNVVPLTVNISTTQVEPAIAVSGYFDEVNSFGSYKTIPVEGLAVWVPSQKNWLQNIASASVFLAGRLDAVTNVPNSSPLWAGTVDSQSLAASNIAVLSSSGSDLEQLPISMSAKSSYELLPLRKRTEPQQFVQGVIDGMYYQENNLNVTILAGHFTAQASNGSQIQNLAFINGSNSNSVTGLAANSSSDASILSLATQGTELFAGGSIQNGYLVYDLVAGAPLNPQPPVLSGAHEIVYSVATQPSSPKVYFGGSFTQAGSLSCISLCIYDNSLRQWTAPGLGLSSDSIIREMQWASDDRLLLAGNMSINGVNANLVSYDTQKNQYNVYSQSSDTKFVPGPIVDFTATDNGYSDFFVAGKSNSNNTAFISKFTSNSSVPSGNASITGTWSNAVPDEALGPATIIESVQIMSLTTSHASSTLLPSNLALMVTGLIEINGVGNATVALFNGTHFQPYILGTMTDGTPGSISQMFVSNPQDLLSSSGGSHLAVGFVVLIALAISLLLIFLLVLIGLAAERYRRHREGYSPAPTWNPSYDKGKVGDISPDRLFSGLSGNRQD